MTVMLKVIRLHMDYVDQLLSDDTDLRVIHLVRDPRGLVDAWKRMAGSTTAMQLNGKLICRRMMTDCQIRRRLELKYPGRILLLRYEDLVTSTDEVLDRVYRGLLELALPSDVVDVINEQVHASSFDGPYGTRRTNGTATATRWRRTVNGSLLHYINDACRPLLDELDYR